MKMWLFQKLLQWYCHNGFDQFIRLRVYDPKSRTFTWVRFSREPDEFEREHDPMPIHDVQVIE